jgi:DNA processing protein
MTLRQALQNLLFDEVWEPTPLIDLGSKDNQLAFWALAKAKGIGFVTLQKLFTLFGGNFLAIWNEPKLGLNKVLSQSEGEKLSKEIISQRARLFSQAEAEYNRLQQKQVFLIFKGTPSYPQKLLALKNPPNWLFVQGNVELLQRPNIIAIVGTRTPSDEGRRATGKLAMALARRGIIILSGLAEGIDIVAHQQAVKYKQPTIAVLGQGLETAVSETGKVLMEQILLNEGAIITEYLPRDWYSREKFVHRNRIQAALSAMVAIMEGKSESGTAHTLRFASELQKPIFGATLQGVNDTPGHQLLKELEFRNCPIFSLDVKEEAESLKRYISQYVTFSDKDFERYIFEPVLDLVSKLISDPECQVKPEDLDLLIKRMSDLKQQILQQHILQSVS